MAAEGKKTFVNETGKDINIVLFIRAGDNPEDEYGTQTVSVSSGGQVEEIYLGDPGSEGYVFLNGLLVEWHDGPNIIGVSRKVAKRGDEWDSILNSNDTVTISEVGAGSLKASGTNK